MTPARKKRFYLFLFAITGAAIALTFILLAAGQNLNHFYEIKDIKDGQAPINHQIRIGGMVKNDSIKRDKESLHVSFIVTDFKNEVKVDYVGILPDLFKEGQGVMLTGKLTDQSDFKASEVLAKHDEKYMPPEVIKQMKNYQKVHPETDK